jgi:hypothetical protein
MRVVSRLVDAVSFEEATLYHTVEIVDGPCGLLEGSSALVVENKTAERSSAHALCPVSDLACLPSKIELRTIHLTELNNVLSFFY